ncbi:hypothetical protein Vretimale_547, partial [Volvox reticuliferus]
QRVAALPAGPLRRAGLAGLVALGAQAAVVLAGRGQAAKFTVLVHRVAKPVNAGIVADGVVGRVHEDHLEVLVARVLVHPVGVQDAQATALAADALLRHAAQVACGLELSDTLVHGLPVDNTLVHRPLAVAAANTHTVNNVSLLSFVAQAAGLVRARRPGQANDAGQLTVLPAPHAEKETEHIALLLPPQLLHVLVSAHVD